MRLKSSLMTLAAGSVVPLLIFAVFAIALLVDRERDTMRRETLGRATSAMSAIDAELRGSITTVQALAVSQNLQRGELRAFHEEAQRVLATQPGWMNIGLATIDRRQLLDANRPFGEHAPFGADDSAFDIAVAQRTAAIGDIAVGTAVTAPAVRVRVPVVVAGDVRYVLSVPIKPESFARILRAQKLEADWAIALVDRNKRFIARIPETTIGAPASESFRAALGHAEEGWFRGTTIEGRDTYTPYVTSALSGWTIGIAIPASAVDAGVWRTFGIAAGGALAALAFALALAWLLGRRIETPFASLARAADAMGRGVPLDLPGGERIDEVEQLRKALRDASAAIAQRQQLADSQTAALERERRALQASDRAKDEFIATLSHELRNPLGALTAAAHLLNLARLEDPVAIQARGVVERQVKQMTRLIEDLLDVSRIVAGKANLKREVFDLGDAVRQLVDMWRGAGRFAAHEVAVDAQPVCVHADRARMDQILSNMLDNALKYTPGGGVIRVGIAREGDEAVLRVADDGDGIEPQALARVFDLFEQGERGPARAKSGLGIGLALVKRLAEMQGGCVEAASPGRGKGSTFVVRVPAVDAPKDAALDAPTGRAEATLGRQRILVIDDNDDMRAMVRSALALEGHDVIEARDGASGVAAALRSVPDVVFVDIGLPDIDGYEVARRLRAQPHGADPHLIAVTGYGQLEDRRRALDAGFDAHLTKPVTPDALLRMVATLADARGAA